MFFQRLEKIRLDITISGVNERRNEFGSFQRVAAYDAEI